MGASHFGQQSSASILLAFGNSREQDAHSREQDAHSREQDAHSREQDAPTTVVCATLECSRW
ncbi:MAG: hypothetical protein F6K31_32190 [Symploca sp. SIO2G7]|nr:hypothetical protein [Symploca sp. SIO2G7]